MIPLYKKKGIQIEITNYCNMNCMNCSRFIGHYKIPYFMSLDQIEQALQSLRGFRNIVGCMGGEPTLHPQFNKICELYQDYIPFERRGLWTNGVNWSRYDKIIRNTFPPENIVYNAHDYIYKGQHQPLLIASEEIIEDIKLRKELIDNCWVQERWGASINIKGGFFCEIAAAMEMLLNLKGGWEIKENWWNKDINEFQKQIDLYCSKCSMSIPFEKKDYNYKKQFISKNNFKLLKKNKIKKIERFEIYTKKYTRKNYEQNIKNWNPGHFRDFYQHEPNVRIYK